MSKYRETKSRQCKNFYQIYVVPDKTCEEEIEVGDTVERTFKEEKIGDNHIYNYFLRIYRMDLGDHEIPAILSNELQVLSLFIYFEEKILRFNRTAYDICISYRDVEWFDVLKNSMYNEAHNYETTEEDQSKYHKITKYVNYTIIGKEEYQIKEDKSYKYSTIFSTKIDRLLFKEIYPFDFKKQREEYKPFKDEIFEKAQGNSMAKARSLCTREKEKFKEKHLTSDKPLSIDTHGFSVYFEIIQVDSISYLKLRIEIHNSEYVKKHIEETIYEGEYTNRITKIVINFGYDYCIF